MAAIIEVENLVAAVLVMWKRWAASPSASRRVSSLPPSALTALTKTTYHQDAY